MIYPKIRCPICQKPLTLVRNETSVKPILNEGWKYPRWSFKYRCTKCGTSLRITVRVHGERVFYSFINRITKWWWWE